MLSVVAIVNRTKDWYEASPAVRRTAASLRPAADVHGSPR
jgi:hypothetical protein